MTKIPLDDEHRTGGTPPCLLNEVGSDGSIVDPQQAIDVARWRKAERGRLLEARQSLSAEFRALETAAIAASLDRLIDAQSAGVVSVYWPIRAEPDLRGWMRGRAERGTRIALPVATRQGVPLIFREWQPGVSLARGLWGIPYPAEGTEVIPTLLIAPVVAFDRQGYRLGYGGGFFDRTLAHLGRQSLAIGVGFSSMEIETIFPQRHDIRMRWIVTGTTVRPEIPAP
jgi:5-formyltetrahydrofolate cyclo-ligase